MPILEGNLDHYVARSNERTSESKLSRAAFGVFTIETRHGSSDSYSRRRGTDNERRQILLEYVPKAHSLAG